MSTISILSTTLADKEAARRLAASLLADKQIACAQITGPITSLFRWQGENTEAEEWQLVVKTTTERAEIVAEEIARLHPYTVPEIITQEVSAVHPPYHDWLRGEVAG